jgi:hypothetical protein
MKGWQGCWGGSAIPILVCGGSSATLSAFLFFLFFFFLICFLLSFGDNTSMSSKKLTRAHHMWHCWFILTSNGHGRCNLQQSGRLKESSITF